MYSASCINRIHPSASSSLGPSLGRTVCQLTKLMMKVLGNLLLWCILKENFSHPWSFTIRIVTWRCLPQSSTVFKSVRKSTQDHTLRRFWRRNWANPAVPEFYPNPLAAHASADCDSWRDPHNILSHDLQLNTCVLFQCGYVRCPPLSGEKAHLEPEATFSSCLPGSY